MNDDKNSLINTQYSNRALTSILLQSDNFFGMKESVKSKFQAAFDERDSLRYH